jgi:hypothetical protein
MRSVFFYFREMFFLMFGSELKCKYLAILKRYCSVKKEKNKFTSGTKKWGDQMLKKILSVQGQT